MNRAFEVLGVLVHIAIVMIPPVLGCWATWVAAAILFAHFAFVPRKYAPVHRETVMKFRLWLRLHPGRGFASTFELWTRWGRFASFRESKRVRPGLSFWTRAFRPGLHSVFLGRAQYRMGLRQTLQEHLLLMGPPRQFKSALLARLIMHYPGAVVSASTKADMFKLTSGVRRGGTGGIRRGELTTAAVVLAITAVAGGAAVIVAGPIGWLVILAGLAVVVAPLAACLFSGGWGGHVLLFNPQGIGGPRMQSTIRWNPVPGCEDESVAMRRGQALVEGVSTKGASDDAFWKAMAGMMMRSLLHAAAVADLDLRAVARWILSPPPADGKGAPAIQQAVNILNAAHKQDWAQTLLQMTGKAERTTATIRLILTDAISFMADPKIAECALPGRSFSGGSFDIREFLLRGDTLYLVGEGRGTVNPIAPLFAGLVSEIHWAATLLASEQDDDRMEPPLALILDEVTQICPIPVPSLLADSGGRGIQMILACHGISQLRDRWGANGARGIMDTANLMVVPGVSDPETLKMLSEESGTATYRQRGSESATADVATATPSMIRRLPRLRGLLLRNSAAPVITRLPLAWHALNYLVAKRHGQAIAVLDVTPLLAGVRDPLLAAARQMRAVDDDNDPHRGDSQVLVPNLDLDLAEADLQPEGAL